MVIAATVLHMIAVAIPNVPRVYVDYSRFRCSAAFTSTDLYGRDSIGNSYFAKVVLNDPLDMYTKARLDRLRSRRRLDQGGISSLSAGGPAHGGGAVCHRSGVGNRLLRHGLLLAALFVALSLWYFLHTRWYLFPLLYLNFAYFGYRFVYVQDDSYLAMLVVVMIALILARARRQASHILLALAITMKLSPAVYVLGIGPCGVARRSSLPPFCSPAGSRLISSGTTTWTSSDSTAKSKATSTTRSRRSHWSCPSRL